MRQVERELSTKVEYEFLGSNQNWDDTISLRACLIAWYEIQSDAIKGAKIEKLRIRIYKWPLNNISLLENV